jgi:type II secretory pathway pseudopilin PulG
MFSIISGILGFATSGLPSLLGFFQQKGDQKHEREMAMLQNQQTLAMAEKGFQSQERQAAIELEGTYAETYAQEREALYTHDAKLVENASQWVKTLNACVRPFVAFTFVGLLVFVDVAGFIWAVKSTGGFTPEAMDTIFSNDEMAIVSSIIGFYFGSRTWEKKRESI